MLVTLSGSKTLSRQSHPWKALLQMISVPGFTVMLATFFFLSSPGIAFRRRLPSRLYITQNSSGTVPAKSFLVVSDESSSNWGRLLIPIIFWKSLTRFCEQSPRNLSMSGILTFLSDPHHSKSCLPMYSIPSGMLILFSDQHLSKAPSPMCVTLSGSTMCSRQSHAKKASLQMIRVPGFTV